jgi:formate C-acetyltransferase
MIRYTIKRFISDNLLKENPWVLHTWSSLRNLCLKQKRFTGRLDLYGLCKHLLQIKNISRENIDYGDPLIIRKSLAFKNILSFILGEVKEKRLDILIGKNIPSCYPSFLTSNERRKYTEIGNFTPGYHNILKYGFNGIYEKIKKHSNSHTKESFIVTIEAIRFFLKELRDILSHSDALISEDLTGKQFAKLIERSPWYPPETFEEALLAVWLVNLLFWYDNHLLIGLGRLDHLLYPYLSKDIEMGIITIEEAYYKITQFYQWLNNSRLRKSNVLLGDTGQTLVIGGIDKGGNDSTNILSYLFLIAAKHLRFPEPKLVARVHKKSSEKYLSQISSLINLQLGYPLVCNDEVIIPALVNGGYTEDDAIDYAVAACWEYFIPGKTFDQCNMGKISFLVAVLEALELSFNKNITSFNDFLDIYYACLINIIDNKVETSNTIQFIPAPLISILTDDCIEKCLDITEGACDKNNYGLLGTSLADAVDSLFAIKEMVFDKKILTLNKLIYILKENFVNSKIEQSYLKYKLPKFGNDNDSVDKLAVDIVKKFADLVTHYKTRYGGRFRPGLGSEGGYIFEAQNIGASPNGRKKGEPYSVNYSPSAWSIKNGPTAVLRSVTKPDLNLMQNCAIVELSMNTSLLPKISDTLEDNSEWIKWLIKGFIDIKGSQLQFNLIDVRLLKEAQSHPEQYKSLLVRVWGFNAYFVDLPKEFQDNIIARVESCSI